MAAISPDTLAAIQKARDDQESAKVAEAKVETASEAVSAATKAQQDANAVSLGAHKTAHDSANAAVDAVKKELGVA